MSNALTLDAGVVSGLRRRWWADAIWASVTNLSQAGGNFLGLLILVRWHGLEAAGQFAYAQAVTAPIAQMLNLQLRALILTHSQSELPISSASSIRAVTSLPAILLCGGLAIVLSPLVGVWMLARLVDSWAEIFQAEQQRLDRMRNAAISVALRAIALVVCLAACAQSTIAALLYVAVSLAVLLLFDWRLSPVGIHLHWPTLGPIVRRGALLGVVLCFQAASASFPRIMIERTADASALGMFAAMSIVVQVGNLLSSSFGQGLLPSLQTAPARRVAVWVSMPFALALLALLCEQLAAPWLLALLHIDTTQAAYDLLLSLGISQLLIWPAGMVGYALTAKKLYQGLLYVGGGMALASAASSLWLIPTWGMTGAAASMTITAGVTLLVSFYFLFRKEVSA